MILEKAHIFIDKDQVPVEVGQYFEENKIEIHSYEDIFNFIEKYQSIENFRFWCDPATVNAAIFKYLNKDNYLEKSSPIVIMKACKNSAEILGMRNSHVRDGAAVVEFLSWLEEYLLQGNSISEYDIDLRLTAERAKDSKFLEPSFSTIAGVNENGAIIHYR
jgi:Xaa-Pro aminopeptidase